MATEKQAEQPIRFYPDHVLTEAKVGGVLILIILGIGALGLLLPVGLGSPADPMNTPEHIKPEWYFLALYQVLKFIPKTAGVLLPIIGTLFLFALPFLDRRPEDNARGIKVRAIIATTAIALVAILTIWGELS